MLANEILTFLGLYLHLQSVGRGERPEMQGTSVEACSPGAIFNEVGHSFYFLLQIPQLFASPLTQSQNNYNKIKIKRKKKMTQGKTYHMPDTIHHMVNKRPGNIEFSQK